MKIKKNVNLAMEVFHEKHYKLKIDYNWQASLIDINLTPYSLKATAMHQLSLLKKLTQHWTKILLDQSIVYRTVCVALKYYSKFYIWQKKKIMFYKFTLTLRYVRNVKIKNN